MQTNSLMEATIASIVREKVVQILDDADGGHAVDFDILAGCGIQKIRRFANRLPQLLYSLPYCIRWGRDGGNGEGADQFGDMVGRINIVSELIRHLRSRLYRASIIHGRTPNEGVGRLG